MNALNPIYFNVEEKVIFSRALKVLNTLVPIESVPSGLPPEEKSDHVLMGKKSTQHVSPIKNVTKTKTDSGLSEKNKVNVLVEEPLPSTSKGKTHYKVIPTTLKSADLCI